VSSDVTWAKNQL